MGLTLSGCICMQTLYGMPPVNLDEDGDGFRIEDGDCAPLDPLIYPGAPETPDDEIDANCDGQDNT